MLFNHGLVLGYNWFLNEPLSSLSNLCIIVSSALCDSCRSSYSHLIVIWRHSLIIWSLLFRLNLLIMIDLHLLTYLRSVTYLSSLLRDSWVYGCWREKVLLTCCSFQWLINFCHLLILNSLLSIARVSFMMRWEVILEVLSHSPWIFNIFLDLFKSLR
jgi:hypothetical protein